MNPFPDMTNGAQPAPEPTSAKVFQRNVLRADIAAAEMTAVGPAAGMGASRQRVPGRPRTRKQALTKSEERVSRQNTSHAVMAQRKESRSSRDPFPTPPWATRALMEHVIAPLVTPKDELIKMSCWEPACGQGYMSKVLHDYFGEVRSSDIFNEGYGEVFDFLSVPLEPSAVDWIITNPPYRLAAKFIQKALKEARVGVAMLTRAVFLEGVGRYNQLFLPHPPTWFGQFVGRVPMLRGRVDKKASTATAYAWIVWQRTKAGSRPQICWIPPCRKQLERIGDYKVPSRAIGTKADA